MPQQPQTDPWVEAAKNFKPQAVQPSAVQKPNEDWKIWQQGADSSSGQPDDRNDIQKSFDENTKTDPGEPLLKTGLKSVAHGIGQPFVHPLDTLKGVGTTLADVMRPGLYPGQETVRKIVEGFLRDKEAGGIPYALTKAGGETLGSTALGEAGGAVLSPVLRAAGAPLERAGLSTLDSYAGQTLPMIRRGQSPAQGMFDEGLVPSMSRHSLMKKVANATEARGAEIGNMVGRSTATLPKPSIASAIERPILSAGDVASGFGGTGQVDPVADLWTRMEHPAPGAGSIYGRNAPANVPVQDVWSSIRNMDKNTRFNPNPEIEGVNEVRRDIRGELRPMLNDAVPGLKDVSNRYSNLKAAEEALERSSRPGKLSKMADIVATPATTATATGLYGTGKLFNALSRMPRGAAGASSALFMGARSPEQ